MNSAKSGKNSTSVLFTQILNLIQDEVLTFKGTSVRITLHWKRPKEKWFEPYPNSPWEQHYANWNNNTQAHRMRLFYLFSREVEFRSGRGILNLL